MNWEWMEKSYYDSKFTKVKCQVVGAYVMKVYRGTGCLTSSPDFQRSASRSGRYTCLERAPISLEHEAEWTPEPVWTFGKKKPPNPTPSLPSPVVQY